MKKLLLVLLFTTMSIFAQDEELNLTLTGGLPMGDVKDFSSFGIGADVNYYFLPIYEDLIAGPSLSFLYFNGKDMDGVKTDASMFLPIGASFKFSVEESDEFFVGTDIGYAIGLAPSNNKKGIYFKPFVGYEFNNGIKVSASYSVIKKKHVDYGLAGINLTYDFFTRGSKFQTIE